MFIHILNMRNVAERPVSIIVEMKINCLFYFIDGEIALTTESSDTPQASLFALVRKKNFLFSKKQT